MKKLAVLFMAALLVLAGVSPLAQATQVTSNTQTVQVSVTVNESISISCTPASVSLTVTTPSATNQNLGGPISCTTNWAVLSSRTQLVILQYFTSNTPFAGLSAITAGMITGSVNGGALTPFSDTQATQFLTAGFFGPNLDNLSLSAGKFVSSQTDTVQLGLNNSNLIPPGTWTATLNIVAVAV